MKSIKNMLEELNCPFVYEDVSVKAGRINEEGSSLDRGSYVTVIHNEKQISVTKEGEEHVSQFALLKECFKELSSIMNK